ncbi:MAG: glycoside hydrolase family 9 protein [Spirochaetales bacterium]|nr:glycoside hydrolase family 9 protein [Spirochaetales bacterium]
MLKKTCIVIILLVIAISLFGNMDTSPIRVNQVGYFPFGNKIATIVSTSNNPLTWELRNSSNRAVLSGASRIYGYDQASGDTIHKADFSAYTTQGKGFKLYVTGIGSSVAFDISSGIYSGLEKDAMSYFYFHRMGEALLSQYLSNPSHARDALHTETSVGAYNNWTTFRFDVRKSWADAGDFGIYTVNHAISAWTLLNLYERYPEAFGDASLRIPEAGNGIPDILDEVKFGSTFVYNMLPSTGGLASHKVHNEEWSSPWGYGNFVNSENNLSRYAQPPSTNATYGVARTLAQIARTYKSIDPTYTSRLWSQAKLAWQRAEAQPNLDYDGSNDNNGGGDYSDLDQSDDRYTAACEMYLTAYALQDSSMTSYKNQIVSDSKYFGLIRQFDWMDVAAAGNISLISAPNDLSQAQIGHINNSLVSFCDNSILPFLTSGSSMEEGYPAPWSGKYPWGSNSFFANRMIMLCIAYDITKDVTYLKGAATVMDYLLGVNAMRLSYITGWGEFAEEDLHDRWAWANLNDRGTAYPAGWLSGGPNNELINDSATPSGQPAAKSYAAPGSAPDAWCSKENTINWNAPLAWVAWYLNSRSAVLSQEEPTPSPTPEANQTILGDVNNDTKVNIVDALLIAQYYVGMPPSVFNTEAANVDHNNSINIVDALLIAQYYVGLISEFP